MYINVYIRMTASLTTCINELFLTIDVLSLKVAL